MVEEFITQPTPSVGRGKIEVSEDGEILFVDDLVARLWGLSAQELLGKSLLQLLALPSHVLAPPAPLPPPPTTTATWPPSFGPDTACSASPTRFHHLIGAHSLMQHLYQLIKLVAETNVTVHISGESGVGKELVADAIHHLSNRSSARFVKLNCSSIPSTLLESALFGHVRGAFTDAHRDQQGFIETAHGGTIFLDEIGEVSADLQVKLLRLLQSHEYSRVGEPIVRKANIRVITATNRDLRELAAFAHRSCGAARKGG